MKDALNMKKPRKNSGLSPVERRDRVSKLAKSGKSKRAIARKLHVDEGTIRRDLKVLGLSENAVSAIRAGAPAKPLLAEEERARRRRQQQVRAREERVTEKAINSGRDLVLKYLEDPDLPYSYKEQILREAGSRIFSDDEARKLPPPAASGTPEEVMAACRPKGDIPSYGPDRTNYYAEWFREGLPRAIPNRTIRNEALRRARVEVERSQS